VLVVVGLEVMALVDVVMRAMLAGMHMIMRIGVARMLMRMAMIMLMHMGMHVDVLVGMLAYAGMLMFVLVFVAVLMLMLVMMFVLAFHGVLLLYHHTGLGRVA